MEADKINRCFQNCRPTHDLSIAGASEYQIAYTVLLQVRGVLSSFHSQAPLPSSLSASLHSKTLPSIPLPRFLPDFHTLAPGSSLPHSSSTSRGPGPPYPLSPDPQGNGKMGLVQRWLLLPVPHLWPNPIMSCPFTPHPFPKGCKAPNPWATGHPLKPPSEPQD